MDIKNFSHAFLVGIIPFFSHCGKEKHSDLAHTYYRMALLDLEDGAGAEGGYRQALAHIDQALSCRQDSVYYALKGSILAALKSYAEAEGAFKQARARAPSSGVLAQIENNHACMLAEQGKVQQACAVWEKLIANKDYLTPEVALVNSAKSFLATHEYVRAHDAITKACSVAPTYVDAWYYKALIEWNALGKEDAACSSLKTVLMLEPHHEPARLLQDFIYEKKLMQ